MLFGRRTGKAHRFVYAQVGLFFIAAGIWLGGHLVGSRAATLGSIALLVVALILGMVGRRMS